jgi:hypothetical protein
VKHAFRPSVPGLFACICVAFVASSLAQAWDSVPPNWVHRVHPTNGLWYDLYIPYSDSLKAGRKYPMVLALHGCCRADDNDPGQVVVGVDNIYRQWHNYGGNTQSEPTWIVAPGSSSSWDTKRDRIFQIMDDLIREFPIDTQRVIITGFSMGGRGCFTFANARPRFFSAIIPAASALSGADDFVVNNVKDIPTWGGVCAGDSWCSAHELTVGPVRLANGDSRGNYRWVTGVNPIFERWDSTCHGESMGYLYGSARVGLTPVTWGLSRVNDGNPYPNVRFTSHEYNDTITAGLVHFAADARDNGQVTKVEFLLEHIGRNDRQVVATVTAPPWEADIWISGERMPVFRIDGSVNVWARAYDNGASQGLAMNKYSTDAIHVYTYGAVATARELARATARDAGIRCAVTREAVRVCITRDAAASVTLTRLDGTRAFRMETHGAGRFEVAREGLAPGSYVLGVVQGGLRVDLKLVLTE